MSKIVLKTLKMSIRYKCIIVIHGSSCSFSNLLMQGYVDSMNMSDHVEFDTPQTSDLAKAMVKRLLEGIPLT